MEARSPKDLRDTGDKIRGFLGEDAVIALASKSDGKALLLVTVGKSLSDRFHAGSLIGRMAGELGCKGGGRPDLAQAGGPRAENIQKALDLARSMVLEG